MGLFASFDTEVEKAYIITLLGNEVSERYSAQCVQSCIKVGQPHEVWPAFDGHANPITVPAHSEHSVIMDAVKVTDHYLTRTEVACVLSHLSLWIRCVLLDRPIVILEHDAVMVRPFLRMERFNSIVWLGSREWAQHKWPQLMIPIHGSEGNNYHFILRAHAYAIDPAMAKNLVAHVLEHGICTSTDVLMRADLFNISHQGLYAYDHHVPEFHATTITNRSHEHKTGRPRNDNLEW